MEGQPETRYARSGEISLAYQVFGDGPRTILVAPGFVSHCEVLWEHPDVARWFERLAAFARVIAFDKREQGMSDRLGRPPTIEEMVDDMVAVLDATGTEQAAVLGISEGGAMALLFAATHPARCTHLALWGTYARVTEAEDYPEGLPAEVFDGLDETLNRDWGGPVAIEVFAPSRMGDPVTEQWWAHLLRSGTGPRSAAALIGLYRKIDVREVLSTISAPTLVLHRAGDALVPPALGRYLGTHIPQARYVEVPGRDHLMWTENGDLAFGEIEEFLTGTRHAQPPQRALATVLFTDIVDSTGHAARLGDRRWRELLDRHDAAVRRFVEVHKGRVIHGTGDGVLATFDGPARAISCARDLVEDTRRLGLEIRAGLHSGECELRGDDVGGIAVHIGARVMDRAASGEVLVSSTVKDLVVGSGIDFADRGSAALKGVPGEWRMYAVENGGGAAS